MPASTQFCEGHGQKRLPERNRNMVSSRLLFRIALFRQEFAFRKPFLPTRTDGSCVQEAVFDHGRVLLGAWMEQQGVLEKKQARGRGVPRACSVVPARRGEPHHPLKQREEELHSTNAIRKWVFAWLRRAHRFSLPSTRLSIPSVS